MKSPGQSSSDTKPEHDRINNSASKSFADLELQNEYLRKLLHEKDIILREVHHRIKNNMNIVRSLLIMQAELEENKSIKNVISDTALRIQMMQELYNKLYFSENTKNLSLNEYFIYIIHQIANIFPSKASVKINHQIENITLPAQTLSALGIILNELITNTMKYAFTGCNEGEINLSAGKKGNLISIVYKDNGNGLPESVTFESSTGFGIQLVNLLTEQIGGTIRIERNPGTKFILEFNS